MGTISQADSFGVQLEALVVERFARAAEEEVVRRCSGKEDTGGGGEAQKGPEVPVYSASLREIKALSSTRLQGLCTRLLAWRASALSLAKDLGEAARRRGEDSCSAPPGGDGGRNVSEADREPARMVDELLAEGLGAAIPAYSGSNLDSEYADSIENILIDLVKSTPNARGAKGEPSVDGNPFGTGTGAVAVLASLSAFRLLVIVGKVQSAAKVLPAAEKATAVRLLQLLGHLQLGLSSAAHMTQSVQTLRILLELSRDKSQKCYSNEVKHAALDATARFLTNSVALREPAVNYAPWDQVLFEVWDHALALRSKSKHALCALRLLAAVVCVLQAEFVDAKAATVCLPLIFASLEPAKSAGTMSKMLCAAGIGSAKVSEETLLTALQALHDVMRMLHHTPPHLRVASSKLLCKVPLLLRGVCEALAANRDHGDVKEPVACLHTVAAILTLPCIPPHITDWPTFLSASAQSTCSALYLNPDAQDLGPWRWSMRLISSMLSSRTDSSHTAQHPAHQHHPEQARDCAAPCLEASAAAAMALQRIVSFLSLAAGLDSKACSQALGGGGRVEEEDEQVDEEDAEAVAAASAAAAMMQPVCDSGGFGGVGASCKHSLVAASLLKLVQEDVAESLAHVLEDLRDACSCVSGAAKDKKSATCPAKLELPLMVLHSVLVLYPALRPCWSQVETITFLAKLVHHLSESVGTQAKLALARLLLSSFSASLSSPSHASKICCTGGEAEGRAEEAEGRALGRASGCGEGGAGRGAGRHADAQGKDGSMNMERRQRRQRRQVDMSVAVEILQAVACSWEAVVDGGGGKQNKGKEREGEREERETRIWRAAELLLALALLFNELVDVATNSYASAVVVVEARGSSCAWEERAVAVEAGGGGAARREGWALKPALSCLNAGGGRVAGWLDTVEGFCILCLSKPSPELRVVALRVLFLVRSWTAPPRAIGLQLPPPLPQQAPPLTVYDSALAVMAEYRAQGRRGGGSHGNGGGGGGDLRVVRVPAALTRPAEPWSLGASSSSSPSSSSSLSPPFSSSSPSSYLAASHSQRSSHSGRATSSSHLGSASSSATSSSAAALAQAEDDFIDCFAGTSHEHNVLRGEVLFDLVLHMAPARPAIAASLGRICLNRAAMLHKQLALGKSKPNDIYTNVNFLEEWLPVVSIALSCACAPTSSTGPIAHELGNIDPCKHNQAGSKDPRKAQDTDGRTGSAAGMPVEALVEILGAQLRDGSNESSVCAAALALGKALALASSFSSSVLPAGAHAHTPPQRMDSCKSASSNASSAASAVGAAAGGGGGSVPSPHSVGDLILRELAPLEIGNEIGGSKALSSLFGAKKHVCRMLVRRLQVLTIAADVEVCGGWGWGWAAAGAGLGAGVGGSMGMEGWVEPKEMQGWEAGAARGMPLQLVSRLVEMAADVVDYVAYLDVKYAKKEAKRDKEAKRRFLLSMFVDFVVTASPHLNRFAPAVAWSPLARSRVFDVVVPLLQHSTTPPTHATANDLSTHSAGSDKSVHWAHGHTGSDQGKGCEEWDLSFRVLKAMAGLQSGPAIPISRHAHASLGLPASAGVSVARDNGSIRDLQEWVNKALLSYEGKWLESAMDFLHNLLVGSTEAMAWCLECCYHTNRDLALPHFQVFSRLVLSQTVSNCPSEEVVSVALYMLGDSRLATRQRAARLLLTTMAQETYVDDWQQSLAEVSGTHYMNAERLKILQGRASKRAAELAESMCAGELVGKTARVLLAKVVSSTCSKQQRQLLSMATPWLARLNLAPDGSDGETRNDGSAYGDEIGSLCSDVGAGRTVIAELLHLTRQVHMALPAEVLALWTALASYGAINVRVCFECFLTISQQLLSNSPARGASSAGGAASIVATASTAASEMLMQSLVAVQMGADGVARGAPAVAVDLLCSQLGSRPGVEEMSRAEPAGISPMLVLGGSGYSGAATGHGGLLQVPCEDDELLSAALGSGADCAGEEDGWDVHGGGRSVATRRDAALVLLAACLDSLLPEAGTREHARLRAHAPAILHAALMCCAGFSSTSSSCVRASDLGASTSPSGICAAGSGNLNAGVGQRTGLVERMVSDACKWLAVLVLRVLSDSDESGAVDYADSAGEQPHMGFDACPVVSRGSRQKMVEVAERVLLHDWMLQMEDGGESQPRSELGARSVNRQGVSRVNGDKQMDERERVLDERGGACSERAPAACDEDREVKRAEVLIEAVLGVVEGSSREFVRDEWSQQALSAACSLPPATPGSQSLGSAASFLSDEGRKGGAHGSAGGVHMTEGLDRCGKARRSRSHAIYRALNAPVRVPDVMLVLHSLTSTHSMGGLSSNSMTSTDSPTNNSLHNHNHSHNTNIPHATTPAHARACAEAVPRQRCEAVQLQLLQELQLECVRTLRHMVRRIDARKLVLAPGLFWATVALLHAPGRRMYEEAVLLFEEMLSSLDITDSCTQNIIFTHCPQHWVPAYNGIKPLLLRGLAHPCTHSPCARLLQVICLVAQIPLLLADLRTNRVAAVTTARELGLACAQRGLTKLSHPLLDVSNGRCTTADGLILLLSPPLCMLLFSSREVLSQRQPSLAVDAARLLLHIAHGGPTRVRRYALELLHAIVRAAPGDGSVLSHKLLPLGASFLAQLLAETHGVCGMEAASILDAISLLDAANGARGGREAGGNVGGAAGDGSGGQGREDA